MKELALSIPGFNSPIPNAPNFQVGPGKLITEPTIGGVLTPLSHIVFFIVGFLMLSWFTWGVFQYIFAGGDKDRLAQARKRLTWAIVGFLIVISAFAISQFAELIFPQRLQKVQNIGEPPQVTSANSPLCTTAGLTVCDEFLKINETCPNDKPLTCNLQPSPNPLKYFCCKKP